MKKHLVIILIIVLTFGVYFISNMVAGLLAGVYFGIVEGFTGRAGELDEFLNRHVNVLLILASIISTFFFMIGFKIFGKKPLKELGFFSLQKTGMIYSVLAGAGFSVFLYAFLSLTEFHLLFPSHHEVIDAIIPQETSFWIIFLSVGVAIPIFEEIMHRGIIFKALMSGYPSKVAILLQALIFAVFHFNLLQGIYAFIGGILLALLYFYSGSLWAPILMHMAWNSTSLFLPPIYSNVILTGLMLSALGIVILSGMKMKRNGEKEQKRKGEKQWIENGSESF